MLERNLQYCSLFRTPNLEKKSNESIFINSPTKKVSNDIIMYVFSRGLSETNINAKPDMRSLNVKVTLLKVFENKEQPSSWKVMEDKRCMFLIL